MYFPGLNLDKLFEYSAVYEVIS